MKKIADILQ